MEGDAAVEKPSAAPLPESTSATNGTAKDEATKPVVAESTSFADSGFDLSKKKKKKKKAGAPVVGEDDERDGVSSIARALEGLTAGSANTESSTVLADKAAAAAEAEATAAAAAAEVPQEFAALDFTGKKKKKKKKVFFDDDMPEDGTGAGAVDGETGERISRREVDPQPWDGTDRDYTYEELLNRAMAFLHGKNPALAVAGGGRKKITLQLPQVAREGTKKTVFLNFGAICKSIHRQQDHLLAYMGAELGTSGNIQDGGRLVIKGRFTADGIANVLKRYMMDYVICQSCRSQDTVLMRDANTRLYFVSCESCGARRSVANISAGYVARVERRKKVG